MKYSIYIDESGSINGMDLDDSIFSVSLSIVPDDKQASLKNWFKREIKKHKKNLGIDLNDELKAHSFIDNEKKGELIKFVEEIRRRIVKDFSAFLINKGLNSKWLENKNITYNFLVKCAIERAISKGELKNNDEIEIFADMREISTGSFNSLSEYLKASFILESNIFKSLKVDFIDSKSNWKIQLADFISYANYNEIRNNVNLENKRKIY